MTLKIGFTNKFYTLWDVTSEIVYGSAIGDEFSPNVTYAQHQKIAYNYIQNLSFDLEQAKLKAKEMGCNDLEVDEDLYGRNSSWETSNKLYCDMPTKLLPDFNFGKYRGTIISECVDINYLLWYYQETQNYFAEKVLLQNGFVKHDDMILSQEEYQDILVRDEQNQKVQDEIDAIKISGYGHIVYTPSRNLDSYGNNHDYHTTISFPNYKTLVYNGFEYGIPTINGVGKKIKGKEVVLLVKVIQCPEFDREILEVVLIKSIDGKQIQTSDILGNVTSVN